MEKGEEHEGRKYRKNKERRRAEKRTSKYGRKTERKKE
jgi:hypothetical protein